MFTKTIDAVRVAAARGESEFVEREDSVALLHRRDEILVTVTVPRDVLEWFVEVSDEYRSVSDWWDYKGYDDTPSDELEHAMATDLASFIDRLESRPLRVRGHKKALVLGWKARKKWKIAVPFGH